MSWIIKQKIGKKLGKYSLPTYCFLRDLREGNMRLQNADEEQSKLVKRLRGIY